MIRNNIVLAIGFLVALAAGLSTTVAAPKKAQPGIQLTEAGRQLEAKYAAELTALRAGAPSICSMRCAEAHILSSLDLGSTR